MAGNRRGRNFLNSGMSLAKRQILETVEAMDDQQVLAVASFIKYLTEAKKN